MTTFALWSTSAFGGEGAGAAPAALRHAPHGHARAGTYSLTYHPSPLSPYCSMVREVARQTGVPEDDCFALMALKEVPDMILEVKRLGLVKEE